MSISIKSFLRFPLNTFKNIALLLRKPRYNAKVFCIGYNKTGTTTLGKSFELLGLRNTSFNQKVWRKYYKSGDIKKVLAFTAKFDSTDDLPWLKEDMIPVLDKAFPGSKFVYLERDEASWQKSLESWALKTQGKMPEMQKELEGFRMHRDFVADYFKNWPSERFLVLNIKDKTGFKKLADFLGIHTEQLEFPHYNRTSDVK